MKLILIVLLITAFLGGGLVRAVNIVFNREREMI